MDIMPRMQEPQKLSSLNVPTHFAYSFTLRYYRVCTQIQSHKNDCHKLIKKDILSKVGIKILSDIKVEFMNIKYDVLWTRLDQIKDTLSW